MTGVLKNKMMDTYSHWLLFAIFMVILLRLCFKDHSNGGGGGYMDFSVLINFFWIFVTIAFILIWGGVYWW